MITNVVGALFWCSPLCLGAIIRHTGAMTTVPPLSIRLVRAINAIQPEFSGFIGGYAGANLANLLVNWSLGVVSPPWLIGWPLCSGVIGAILAQLCFLRIWTRRWQFNPRHWVRLHTAHYGITAQATAAEAWCRQCCRGAWVIVFPFRQGTLDGYGVVYFNRKNDFAMFTLWESGQAK